MRAVILVIALIVFVCLPCSLLSLGEDSLPRFRFGAFVGANANFHAASFGSLAGFPSCCPQYTSGAGLTPAGSLFIEIPLSASFSHMVRVSLSDLRGQMSSVESEPVIIDHTLQTARIQHSLEADIKGIGIEPLVHFRIADALGLFAGLRCEFSLKGLVTQREELVAPEVGTFENGSRIRNEQSGKIFALQPIFASAVGGIRFELPMRRDRSLLFIPELSFAIGLNTITGSEEWRVHSLRAGVSIAFQSPAQRTAASYLSEAPTLQADISIVPFDGQRELNNQRLRLEESESIDIQPLLPFIFFDANSEALPARYASRVEGDLDSFDVRTAARSTALSSYYNILTVVGKRLRDNGLESITLIGILDSSDNAPGELARRRAENISRYFQKVWGIDKKRIHAQVRKSSGAEANTNNDDPRSVAAENRRVELSASTAILGPLQRRDTSRAPQPRFVRVRPHIGGTDPTEHWEIMLTQRGRLLKSFSGTGAVPFKLSADILENPVELSADSIVAVLIVNGKSGLATSASASIQTETLSLSRKLDERIPDSVAITVQFLVLPGADNDATRVRQMELLRSLPVNISSTDLIDFSDTSARNAQDLQQRFALSNANVRARSTESFPYSSAFPENRFYNRSVLLRMKSVR